MSYAFCTKNRIEQPHSYMYTPFLGRDFLRDYFAIRREARARLIAAIEGRPSGEIPIWLRAATSFLASDTLTTGDEYIGLLCRLSAPDPEKFSLAPNSPLAYTELPLSGAATIPTRDALISVVQDCVGQQNLEVDKTRFDPLISRFEVTKRIYEEYAENFRNGSGPYDDIELYAIAALALALAVHQRHSLRYLNCLLKLNDLLCSVLDTVERNGLISIGSALMSIVSETRTIAALVTAHGIKLDASN